MPVGEPQPENIPSKIIQKDNGNAPISSDQLRWRMQLADVTFDTTERSPQFSESIQDVQQSMEPVFEALIKGVKDGSVSAENAVKFLSRDRAIASEAANMDDLSETYRRQHLEKRLDALIQKLMPDETIEVDFYDLVNFKNVNDVASQQGGDRVLKEGARVFKKRHPNGTGGRIGDEFVFFEKKKKVDASEEQPTQPSTELPEKLMDATIRGAASIPVYLHHGKATYDPTKDTQRTEEREINGQRIREAVTPARSLINRANAIADQNKALNKQAHPELYLQRQPVNPAK